MGSGSHEAQEKDVYVRADHRSNTRQGRQRTQSKPGFQIQHQPWWQGRGWNQMKPRTSCTKEGTDTVAWNKQVLAEGQIAVSQNRIE